MELTWVMNRTGPKISVLALVSIWAFSKGRSDSLVSGHVGRSADDGRADPVALCKAFDLRVSPIQQDLRSLVHGSLDQSLDTLLGCGRDDWSAAMVSTIFWSRRTSQTHTSVEGSKPLPTFSLLARSTSSGTQLDDSPTVITVGQRGRQVSRKLVSQAESAMHR